MRRMLLTGLLGLLAMATIFPGWSHAAEAAKRAEGLSPDAVNVADTGYTDGYTTPAPVIPEEGQFPTPDETAVHPFGDDTEILHGFEELFLRPLPGFPIIMLMSSGCGCTCDCPCDCSCGCHDPDPCDYCGNVECSCYYCSGCGVRNTRHGTRPCGSHLTCGDCDGKKCPGPCKAWHTEHGEKPCKHYDCDNTCECVQCGACGAWGKPGKDKDGNVLPFHSYRPKCHYGRRSCQDCDCCECDKHDWQETPPPPTTDPEATVWLWPRTEGEQVVKIKINTTLGFQGGGGFNPNFNGNGWDHISTDASESRYEWSGADPEGDDPSRASKEFTSSGEPTVSVKYYGSETRLVSHPE